MHTLECHIMPADQTDQPSSSPPPPGDGRRHRTTTTRAALIDACTQLIEGGMDPTAGDVASAAGCSKRTLFSHFASMAELLRACGYERLVRYTVISPETSE